VISLAPSPISHRAVTLTPSDDYAQLRVWLVEARVGDRARATRELTDVIRVRTAAHADALGDGRSRIFLVGDLTEADLLKAAHAADPEVTRGQECEAYFYSGWVRLMSGDASGARDAFTKSVATDKKTFWEWTSAAAELRALAGKVPPTRIRRRA